MSFTSYTSLIRYYASLIILLFGRDRRRRRRVPVSTGRGKRRLGETWWKRGTRFLFLGTSFFLRRG